MEKEKIRVELDAFIESGKAKAEVNSGNFVTTHIDILRVAEHFYEQAEKDFMEKAEKWLKSCLDNGCWVANNLCDYDKKGIVQGFREMMSE